MYTEPVILQAAAVIAKTTETLIGTIGCEKAEFISLFLDYTNGDETGLYVVPYAVGPDGAEYQLSDWDVTTGLYTRTAIKFHFTATAKAVVVIDVDAFQKIKLYQGGSDNDGTPTGTLAVSYVLKE